MVLPQQATAKEGKKKYGNRTARTGGNCYYWMVPTAIVTAVFLVIYYLSLGRFTIPSLPSSHYRLRTSLLPPLEQEQQQKQQQMNELDLLYIVTSSNEYNTGAKATRQGQDRFIDIVVPVIIESIESLLQTFEHVDVVLILGYTLRPERQAILQQLLQPGVGLEIWQDATPLHYDFITRTRKFGFIQDRDRVLARQHRYVVKDKLPYYDFFLAFEDDMLIRNHHVLYHMEFMEEISRLKKLTPSSSSSSSRRSPSSFQHPIFWGSLTIDQLNHIRPGLLRVEVLTNGTLNEQEYEEHHQTQQHQPFRLAINTRAAHAVDARLCCHRNNNISSSVLLGQEVVGLVPTPSSPTADQVMVWESAIAGMHVRKMPETSTLLDWVAVLPIQGQTLLIPGYWSGTHGTLGPNQKKKPSSSQNEYIAQSAGWMASREEVMDFDRNLCKGKSFLPPFDAPQVVDDGLSYAADSVEYWSGGLQLWGQQCNIQRLVALQPELFSKHLIYHTANNKQHELPPERFTKSSTLLGQLHAVVQAARQEQRKISSSNTRRGRVNYDNEEGSWWYRFWNEIRLFVA